MDAAAVELEDLDAARRGGGHELGRIAHVRTSARSVGRGEAAM